MLTSQEQTTVFGLQKGAHVHMLGMGGSGMAGIAEVLLGQGYRVSGSDQTANDLTCRLSQLGADVAVGLDRGRFEGAEVAVVSSAIASEHPELQAIQHSGIKTVKRAEMLAELIQPYVSIALAGTHGKTTTAGLLVNLLLTAKMEPSCVVGGFIKAVGSHARLGSGPYMIVEADESDASFLRLHPKMAVITNIDADHMATFNYDIDELHAAFLCFLRQPPEDNLLLVCKDDIGVQKVLKNTERDCQTYGFDEDCDFRIVKYQNTASGCQFNVQYPKSSELLKVELPLVGRHNALNATAAIAVAVHLGVADAVISDALATFAGVSRRTEWHSGVKLHDTLFDLVDDYGHHPDEVEANINAWRESHPDHRLIMIFQPHRYSRTRDCYQRFIEVLSRVDVLIMLEVYAASEEPITAVDSASLCNSIQQFGVITPILATDQQTAVKALADLVGPKDLVIIQGAGDIALLAKQLLKGEQHD